MIARVRHVSYQQQSSTFGHSAGVFGLTSEGSGFVAGGGGFVETQHRGIVNVVLEDEDGRLANEELPAAVAALENGIVRLDLIDDAVVAVTNLSGRRDRLILRGPSAFVGRITLERWQAILLLAALISAGQARWSHPREAIVIAVLLGIAPALQLARMHVRARRRRRLERYMVEVMS